MQMTTESAVKPAETAEQFAQKVRRATRRKFGAEEKIRIILEGLKREVSTADLCRHERIHPHIYYSGLKDFMEGGKSRLREDGVRNSPFFTGAKGGGIPGEIGVHILRGGTLRSDGEGDGRGDAHDPCGRRQGAGTR